MVKPKTSYFLILILLLTACSVEVSNAPVTSTPVPPLSENDAPSALETAPPWAELNLSGQLIFIASEGQQQKLLKLDLTSGEQTTLFDPPKGAWLSSAAVSPDGQQIVIAYAPPTDSGSRVGFTDLYLLSADGSSDPTLLLQRAEPSETYFNVNWPAQESIYYAHFSPSVGDHGEVIYASQIERLQYPKGTVEVVATGASWPRVSLDGTHLAYVTDSNELVVADADGANPTPILTSDVFQAVDAPLFSPDGNTLYFSAIEPEPVSSRSFWDRLLGVRVAQAHGVPSDWWRMPADCGGEPDRLTNIYEIGLYGDFGPDGRHIAFISSNGVQIMSSDGSGLFQLNKLAASGTISWVIDR